MAEEINPNRHAHVCQSRKDASCRFCNLLYVCNQISTENESAKNLSIISKEKFIPKQTLEGDKANPDTIGDVEVKDELMKNEPMKNNSKVRQDTKLFPCDKCETIFPSLRRLNQHIAKIHELKKNCHVCDICQMKFSKRGKLESHMSKTHTVIANVKVEVDEEPKSHQCDQCVKKFNFKQNLLRHIRLIHEGKNYIYECQQCTKIFKSQAGLYRHVQSVHEERKFPCDKCGLSFTEKQSLINHRNTIHEGIRMQFLCHQCGKIYHSRGGLSLHLAFGEHTELMQSIFCEICLKTYNNEKDFETHNSIVHHPVVQKIELLPSQLHKCDICAKQFSSEEYLKSHQICHLSFNAFIKKEKTQTPATATASNYVNALKLHECDICGKLFASAEYLNFHRLKIHQVRLYKKKKENRIPNNIFEMESIIELHKCKICGKQFSSAEYLKNHRNCHKNALSSSFNIKPLLPIKPLMSLSSSDIRIPTDSIRNTDISILPTQPLKLEELYPPIQTRCNICMMKFSSEEFLKIHQKKNCYQSGDQLFKMAAGFKPNTMRTATPKKTEAAISLLDNAPNYLAPPPKKKKPIELSNHAPPSAATYPVVETIFHVCGKCGKRFQTLINLSMHIKGVHEGFDFRINHICNLCDMPFPNKITLLSHKRRDHETYKCEICYRVFPNEIIFRSHVATSHSGKKHRCENCTRTYCDKWSLIHHMIEDHGAKHLLQRKNQGPKCPYIKM